MTLLHTLIKQKSNAELADAIENKYPDIAQWVRLHPSSDSILGFIPGVKMYLKQRAVTLKDLEELIPVLEKHRWYFDTIAEILHHVETLTNRVELKPTRTMHHRDIHALMAKQIEIKRTPIFTDANLMLPAAEDLSRVLKELDFAPDRWEEEVHDCDEKAGYLWGLFQRTTPGNTAIGFATICGEMTSGAVTCHALLIAVCDDEKLYWVENNGRVYPLGELPGWKNETLVLDVSLF